MIIICKKYPQLRIYDLKLVFDNGKIETEDPEVVGKLKQMKGVEFEFVGKIPEKAASDADGAKPPERDMLKARAAELGVTYPNNISTDKLAALVAEAEAKTAAGLEGGAPDDGGNG